MCWDPARGPLIRGRFGVAPLEQWNVRRDYLRRPKRAFDAHGIKISFSQLKIHLPIPRASAST